MRPVRTAIAVALLVGTTSLAPAALVAPSAAAATVTASHHKCTRTSSGSCIRGGEFCPKAAYGHHGWDAKGRRYTCKGSHSHPHWEK